MLIYLDIGHNALRADTGSLGIKKEDELSKLVGQKLRDYLEKNSEHKIICPVPSSCVTVNESLRSRVEKANESEADLFVSIHFNAFNKQANGTEVFISREESTARPIAQRILNKIVALGFVNRGVKVANYYVIKNTTMQAVLVECCFIDSDKDMQLFDADKMAEAIAEGILNKDIPSDTEVVPHNHLAVMVVAKQTYLKPSTDDSVLIPKNELKTISPGSYEVNLLADEEAHYLVEGIIDGATVKGFVYSKHVQLKFI